MGDMLKQSLNSSRVFLEKSKDLVIPAKPKETEEAKAEDTDDTADKNDGETGKTDTDKKEREKSKDEKKVDEGLFTAKELESLEKKIADVEKWRDEKVEEQEKMPLSEMPKLTVSLIKSKIQDLDSEVQLLIGKARMIRAERERAKRKAEEEKAKKEKKDKKKKKKEKDSTKSEEEKEESKESDPTEPPVPSDEDTTSSKDSAE